MASSAAKLANLLATISAETLNVWNVQGPIREGDRYRFQLFALHATCPNCGGRHRGIAAEQVVCVCGHKQTFIQTRFHRTDVHVGADGFAEKFLLLRRCLDSLTQRDPCSLPDSVEIKLEEWAP